MKNPDNSIGQLEAEDDFITMKRASELSGVAVGTLRNQASAGKLKTIKPAHDQFTTRRWLHEYLIAASERDKGARKPLPADYVAPE